MISAEESLPSKSESFLRGLDVFYTQFNDISFFIEDEDSENFYFEIFVKLFPDITLDKIFPLRGKLNVINESQRNIGKKDKIFIVDKDFDDLLGKKINQNNLFYLDRYSIENYLIEEEAIIKYIIEEKPKINIGDIKRELDFLVKRNKCCRLFFELTVLYLLVQSKDLSISNASQPVDKYFQFHNDVACIRERTYNEYKQQIQEALRLVNKRYKLEAQIKRIKREYRLKGHKDVLCHIPGKYMVRYFKYLIEHIFCLKNCSIDSFTFRLAKNNNFEELTFLKVAIQNYIK